jgi:SAM-dependent methyltransferase
MPQRVCPWWIGYLLASPARRLLYRPERLLQPYVRAGMTILEPGPGMGFFTLDLARMAGPSGRVVAVDIQRRMLDGLKRRAAKAGLLERLDIRLARPDSMGLADLAHAVDFALAFAVVHEMPSGNAIFAEIAAALKPGACLLLVEPAGHVTAAQFRAQLEDAGHAGLAVADRPKVRHSHAALLRKA